MNNSRGRVTDHTLADQLKITDREIEYRKGLLGITEADVAAIVSCRDFVSANLNDIIDEFYDVQLKISDVELLIGDADTLMRLSAAMKRYLVELFEGYYDSNYANKRLRVGIVHKRIGLSPSLYFSAISNLQLILLSFFEKMPEDDGTEFSLAERHSAVGKLMNFDVQLAFDTYIGGLVNEVERAKADVEIYAASLEDEIAARTAELEEMSRTDALTGLPNHRAFYEHLRREMAEAERYARPLSLVYADVNGFKKLNDTKGHKAGDRCLEALGKVFAGGLRGNDVACRYGGDEFCFIMPETTALEAEEVCRRLIASSKGKIDKTISLSVGIAQAGPVEYPTLDALISAADGYMYEAKEVSRRSPGDHLRLAAVNDLPDSTKKPEADCADAAFI